MAPTPAKQLTAPVVLPANWKPPFEPHDLFDALQKRYPDWSGAKTKKVVDAHIERAKLVAGSSREGDAGYNAWDALTTGVRNGLSFGTADEISGLIGGLGATLHGESYLDTYRQIRDQDRFEQKTVKRDYPKTTLAGEIAGSAIPLLLAGPGAKITEAIAPRMASALARRGIPEAIAKTVATRTIRGGVEGGLMTALTAAGESEKGLLGRAGAAVEAAPTGIVGGAALANILPGAWALTKGAGRVAGKPFKWIERLVEKAKSSEPPIPPTGGGGGGAPPSGGGGGPTMVPPIASPGAGPIPAGPIPARPPLAPAAASVTPPIPAAPAPSSVSDATRVAQAKIDELLVKPPVAPVEPVRDLTMAPGPMAPAEPVVSPIEAGLLKPTRIDPKTTTHRAARVDPNDISKGWRVIETTGMNPVDDIIFKTNQEAKDAAELIRHTTRLLVNRDAELIQLAKMNDKQLKAVLDPAERGKYHQDVIDAAKERLDARRAARTKS